MTPPKTVPLALAWLALAGCSSAEPDPESVSSMKSQQAIFEGRFEPVPNPPATGENALEMSLFSQGRPLAGATVRATPWMPAHGHGSHTTPLVHEHAEGHYRASQLVYTMPGAWDVTVEVDAGGKNDSFVISLDVR